MLKPGNYLHNINRSLLLAKKGFWTDREKIFLQIKQKIKKTKAITCKSHLEEETLLFWSCSVATIMVGILSQTQQQAGKQPGKLAELFFRAQT